MRSSFVDDLYLNEKTFNCQKLLEEFQVPNETALQNMLIKESKTVPCIRCGREFPINQLDFSTGDPICKHCQ
jgi:DNA-directed RNA polymerase subunit RPC12/RpoP